MFKFPVNRLHVQVIGILRIIDVRPNARAAVRSGQTRYFFDSTFQFTTTVRGDDAAVGPLLAVRADVILEIRVDWGVHYVRVEQGERSARLKCT